MGSISGDYTPNLLSMVQFSSPKFVIEIFQILENIDFLLSNIILFNS